MGDVMNYKLVITKRAEKELNGIPKGDSTKIHTAIMALKINLKGDVKKLVNHSPEYRLKVGNWRVLFEIENDTVVIARVLNRKEAYRD